MCCPSCRVDAAINEAMEGDQASSNPPRCCGASFGGAASPDQGVVSSPAQARDVAVDAAVLHQIVDGVRRSQQGVQQPWWLAAADIAGMAGQQRAGKHARCGSGEPSLSLS